MTNITPNSSDDKVYPPGKKIAETGKLLKIGTVTFPNNKEKIPFSPVVQAFKTKDNKKLQINAVVFVTSFGPANNELNFEIYQNQYIDLNGKLQAQFFICYDLLDDPGTVFDIYEISFDANKKPFGKHLFTDVNIIQTFLWDIDPETSRGTESVVQKGN
jgi:hypothetical protein